MTGGVIVSGKYLLITTIVPSICLYSDSVADLHVTSVAVMLLNERCFQQAVNYRFSMFLFVAASERMNQVIQANETGKQVLSVKEILKNLYQC